MKSNVGRVRRVIVWLGMTCLGLVSPGPLSAQEPNLRDTLKGHKNVVNSLAYSPDGKTLVSGSSEMTIKLWDVATGKERATLEGHGVVVYSVVFSPDGKTLASGSIDKTVKLWVMPAAKKADK